MIAPSTANPSATCTAGWTIIRGMVPRCGQVAVCTMNGWHKNTSGTLPAVSWITPSQANSDHAPASLATGQAYVTNLINTIMKGPDWDSTAIFLAVAAGFAVLNCLGDAADSSCPSGVGMPVAGATVAVMIYRLISLWLVLLIGWILFIVIWSMRARRTAA